MPGFKGTLYGTAKVSGSASFPGPAKGKIKGGGEMRGSVFAPGRDAGLYVPPPMVPFLLQFDAFIREEDQQPGIYYGVVPLEDEDTARFKGAIVYWSPDDTNWEVFAHVAQEAVIGFTETALSSVSGPTRDTTNTVDLELFRGSLESVVQAEAERGMNAMMIGNELIAFETATVLGTRRYRLSNLHRMRRGTASTGHATDELVMLIDGRIRFKPLKITEIGETRYFKVVPVGATLADAVSYSLVLDDTVWKPLGKYDFGAMTVKDRTLTTPPSTPAEGDRHIVGPSASGAWNGLDNKIVEWRDERGWIEAPLREGMRVWVEAEDAVVAYSGSAWVGRSVDEAITAATTQTQGQQPLVQAVNRVSVVANANDVVTLPKCATGKVVVIINDGANDLQVFPASGDAIDTLAANTSVTLVPNERASFYGTTGTAWSAMVGSKA